jgi:hypothetical protein
MSRRCATLLAATANLNRRVASWAGTGRAGHHDPPPPVHVRGSVGSRDCRGRRRRGRRTDPSARMATGRGDGEAASGPVSPAARARSLGANAAWTAEDVRHPGAVGRPRPGRDQPASGSSPLGAAEYDPRANRWATIAAPPMLKGQHAVAASGGGQMVVVLNSGATYSWRQAAGRWQKLGSLPAGRSRFSVAWTGSTFLVTRLYRWKQPGPGQAFGLTGHRWQPLPDLPEPPRTRGWWKPLRSSSTAPFTCSPASL